MLDLAQAFERLCTAESLPAAVGLFVDGLDEYDAPSSEQMQMAEVLCRAAQSPHLKIIVSSRPEAAFEAVFRDSSKLRLHELTDEDRRTYTSDKLKAVTRFDLIATEREQTQLIDLVVDKSEGIFLWVNLAVTALIQEIALSLNISRLVSVVGEIPSGKEGLSRVFDHILRNRIPIEDRPCGFRMIHTLQYGYSLKEKLLPWVSREDPPPKHPITALLYSFFEDDVTSALRMPVKALETTKAAVRIEMAAEMTRRYSAGLLEFRHQDESDINQHYPRNMLSRDPEVHFLHKDVALYLNKLKTSKFMDTSLKSVRITIETNLLKCVVMMAKLYNSTEESSAFEMPLWDIWHHTEMIMRIARATEGGDLHNTVALLDELDKVLAKHYNLLPHISDIAELNSTSSIIDQETARPPAICHWTEHFPIDPRHDKPGYTPGDGQCSNFLSFAIEQGLTGYLQAKVGKYGKEAIRKSGLTLLSSACGTKPIWWLLPDSVQPSTVRLLLLQGADPNQIFQGVTC